ncbi:conserved protein of unknown function [Nitrospina watsonii]|uniref:DUF3095 domain-containing protein n=2 Tax=Nitrospina watsonii TaxID=1323948 RepID=A0ABM9HFX7_9BACT|nr:conserved protein of unknown function [Nitrospina watsonii]
MNSDHFYRDLSALGQFETLAHLENFHEVPGDWYIAFTDVVGSTKAIERGEYKAVNNVGASSIMAVLNAVKPFQVPYVFGGDGSTVCFPASCLEAVQKALCAARIMAHESFDLELRVGAIPVRVIHAASSARVRVAKVRVSPYYDQALFSGGGLTHAETILKDEKAGAPYRLDPQTVGVSGDFNGLECRWDVVPSPHEETVTVLVSALSDTPEAHGRIYKEVLEKIQEIYGETADHHPLREYLMRLTRSNRALRNEFRIRTWGKSLYERVWYWFDLWIQQLIGYFVVERDVRFAGIEWGNYKPDFVANSDFRKFDDLLRYVLSGSVEQRKELKRYLESRREKFELVYGLHPAPGALVTCMIFNYNHEHIHFVDGAEGGYAMAAKKMKAQLKRLAQSPAFPQTPEHWGRVTPPHRLPTRNGLRARRHPSYLTQE